MNGEAVVSPALEFGPMIAADVGSLADAYTLDLDNPAEDIDARLTALEGEWADA